VHEWVEQVERGEDQDTICTKHSTRENHHTAHNYGGRPAIAVGRVKEELTLRVEKRRKVGGG
jgi:hypothetical protein